MGSRIRAKIESVDSGGLRGNGENGKVRLIEADNFMRFMGALEGSGAEHVSFVDLRKFINSQPTAYDVDKVVDRLEKNKKEVIKSIEKNEKSEYHLIKIKDLKELFREYTREQIETVKSGGIE